MKLVLDENLVGEFIVYTRKEGKIDLSLDEQDSSDTEAVNELVTGAVEFISSELAKNKSKEQPVYVTVPGLITMGVNFRESEAGGNWGVDASTLEEFNKIVEETKSKEE